MDKKMTARTGLDANTPLKTKPIAPATAVRLKLEQNQLVDVFGEIGVLVDALEGA